MVMGFHIIHIHRLFLRSNSRQIVTVASHSSRRKPTLSSSLLTPEFLELTIHLPDKFFVTGIAESSRHITVSVRI